MRSKSLTSAHRNWPNCTKPSAPNVSHATIRKWGGGHVWHRVTRALEESPPLCCHADRRADTARFVAKRELPRETAKNVRERGRGGPLHGALIATEMDGTDNGGRAGARGWAGARPRADARGHVQLNASRALAVAHVVGSLNSLSRRGVHSLAHINRSSSISCLLGRSATFALVGTLPTTTFTPVTANFLQMQFARHV